MQETPVKGFWGGEQFSGTRRITVYQFWDEILDFSSKIKEEEDAEEKPSRVCCLPGLDK